MRAFFVLLLAVGIAIPVCAQRGHSGGFGGGGRVGGGGAFRGGGSGGFRSGGGVFRGGYGGGFGFRNNFRYGGLGRGAFYGRGWRGLGYFGLPYYWPGYYGFGYAYDPFYSPYYGYYGNTYAAPAYSYDYGYGAPAQQSPVVIVNQQEPPYYGQQDRMERRPFNEYRYERPEPQGEREDSAPPPPAAYRPTIYKLAFQDHRIVSALAYWVKDGRLHYVTLDHAMVEVPVSSIDRRYSEQVNRDQGVPFRLPAEN